MLKGLSQCSEDRDERLHCNATHLRSQLLSHIVCSHEQDCHEWTYSWSSLWGQVCPSVHGQCEILLLHIHCHLSPLGFSGMKALFKWTFRQFHASIAWHYRPFIIVTLWRGVRQTDTAPCCNTQQIQSHQKVYRFHAYKHFEIESQITDDCLKRF